MDSSFDYTGVAYHVRVGEVQDDQIIVLKTAHHLETEVRRAHLRLFVVGRDFLRTNGEVAVFTFERGLDTTVEEESDVWILFRLRRAELLQTGVGHDFPEDVPEALRSEYHSRPEIVVGRVVFCQGVVGSLGCHFAIETVEVSLQERVTKLAGAVSPEVEPENDVPIIDALLIGVIEDHRLHELITTRIAGVGGLHSGARRIAAHFATTEDNGIPRELVALPALVAVHGVVAADDGGDLRAAGHEILFKLRQIGSATSG